MPPYAAFPLRLHDPAREREAGRRLLAALGVSVGVHVAAVALWAITGGPPERRATLDAYPATFDVVEVEPAPSGGGGTGDAAPSLLPPDPPPATEAPPPSATPPTPVLPPEAGVPVPVARSAETPHPPVAAPAPRPSIEPPLTASAGTGSGASSGSGGGSGGGAGTGSGTGVGARAGPGSGDGNGTGTALAGPVTTFDRPPRMVTPPLPINTEETARGALRGRARIEVVVNEEGRVTDARIVERVRLGRRDREEPVSALPAELEDHLLARARRSEFRPARLGGQPVTATASITLSFGL